MRFYHKKFSTPNFSFFGIFEAEFLKRSTHSRTDPTYLHILLRFIIIIYSSCSSVLQTTNVYVDTERTIESGHPENSIYPIGPASQSTATFSRLSQGIDFLQVRQLPNAA